MKYSRLFLAFVVICLGIAVFAVPLHATDGVWAGSSEGNWSDPDSWENQAIPNGIDAMATIRSGGSRTTCNVDMHFTLGHLVFENYGRYDIMDADPWNPKTIQLATTSGSPSITVNGYADPMVGVSLEGNQGLDKLGRGSLWLDGGDCVNSYTGVTTIHAGSLIAGKSSALGASGVENETVVLDGANLTVTKDANVSEATTITGVGENHSRYDDEDDSLGALQLWDSAKISGPITLSGDAMIVQRDYWDSAEPSITGTITGTIALPDEADVTFKMHRYSSASYNAENFTTSVSGAISGTGGVTVTKKGTLVLSGNNTYSGGSTASNSGVLSVSSDANLGDADSSVVLDGGTLKITGTSFTSTSRDIELLSGGGTIEIDAGHSFEIATSLAGSGNLIKEGYGKLSLTKDCGSYTGDITIKRGTLGAGIQNSLSSQTRVTIKSDAKLEFQGDEDFGSLAGDRGATVYLKGNNIRFGSDNTDAEYKGRIIGTTLVSKFGTGTQTLSGDLTYTGDTEVQNGRLILEGDNEAMTGDILIQDGATLRASEGNAISSSTRINMELGSTFTVLDSESIGSLDGDGTVNLSYFNGSSKELSVGQDNTDSDFAGTIIGDGGKLTKLGTGTLTLSGRSTYTGKTTVAEGTLVLNDALAIAGSSTTEIQDGATLQAVYMNSLQDSNHVDVKEGGILDMPAGGAVKSFTGAGTINGYGQTIFAGADNSDFTFEGTLNRVRLAKQGTGTCTIAGDREGGFDAVVEAGTLRFEKRVYESSGLIDIQSGARVESTNNGIGDQTDVAVAAGATLALEAYDIIGSLSGAGSVILPTPDQDPDNSLPYANTGLEVSSEDSSKTTTFSGIISGEGCLVKNGEHTLVLDSANTYTGGTILVKGCLVANHNQAFGSETIFFGGGELQINEDVTITNQIDFSFFNHGGTLCGNGTLQSDLVMDNFVLIAPGNHPLHDSDSIGQLTIDGDYTQNEESYLHIELAGIAAGDYDVLYITGQATFAGTLYVEFSEGFSPTNGNSFDILDWGSIANSEFDTYILPKLDEGLYWNTSKLYTTGEIFVTDSTAVPEPATLALLLALPVFGWICRRRQP